ncbi:Immunoglobulin domain-containing protein [Fasciola gigantica]|uniref:Immunoglobulin domain-containing protein n=1 Tax=Fasciola gigantica TaxID=46835 RepID=A0A504YQ33_FASGI|nr:Immunoglobulin domain-containing protein [Fasciola gigantica]
MFRHYLTGGFVSRFTHKPASMLVYLLLCALALRSVDAVASCTQNADLVVHKEIIQHGSLTFKKTVVNKTVPIQVTYTIQANQLKQCHNTLSLACDLYGLPLKAVPLDFNQCKSITYHKLAAHLHPSFASSLKTESISWLHNNEPIKIDDKANQEVYYTTETLDDSIIIGLHFRIPTSPVLRPRLGAVRGQEGNPLTVTCEVDSYPPPSRIRWQRLQEKDGVTRLVPVTNATFRAHNGVEGATMEWVDASAYRGFYLCQAISPRGTDSILVEVRIKGMKDILWPAVGILIQLFVLLIIIVVYERSMAKRRAMEEAKSADPKTK